MKILDIKVKKENHTVDTKFSKRKKLKIIKIVEYVLYKGIKEDVGIIHIINSLNKEKTLFLKKYSPFDKAENDYNKRILKFMGKDIFNFCQTYIEQKN